MEPILKEMIISVRPHPSDKRPGFNVIATRIIRMGDQEIEDSMVLNSFRRVKSNESHRKQEANEYALAAGRLFGVMTVNTL